MMVRGRVIDVVGVPFMFGMLEDVFRTGCEIDDSTDCTHEEHTEQYGFGRPEDRKSLLTPCLLYTSDAADE